MMYFMLERICVNDQNWAACGETAWWASERIFFNYSMIPCRDFSKSPINLLCMVSSHSQSGAILLCTEVQVAVVEFNETPLFLGCLLHLVNRIPRAFGLDIIKSKALEELSCLAGG